MSKKVFISYCHKQGDWVTNRLAPCLRAGGAEVLIDIERFRAGRAVISQMDGLQDQADATALILSPDYLQSDYCRHEMARAIARDPRFANGATLPVKREECEMPDEIASAEAIWINLLNDKDAAQWDLLLDACDAELHADAPHWLEVRDEIRRELARGKSVNLVVTGNPRWRQLIHHLRADHLNELGIIDFDDGVTATRTGLVAEILKACGIVKPVPPPPEDLVTLSRELAAHPRSSLLALAHFDFVLQEEYGNRLLPALRHLVTEKRKLVLLAQSRKPFAKLLPNDDPFASADIFTMVELRGRER